MSSIQLYVDGAKVYDNGVPITGAIFAQAVVDAWNADTVLNWTGGNITLTSPIVLEFNTTWKFNFGLRLNGARILCNFNDATKYALTIQAHDTTGNQNYVQNVGARGFQIVDGYFAGLTPYAGAIELKCKTAFSWIASFLYRDLNVSGFSDYAFRFTGSVFEFVLERLITENGKGALYIQQIGTGTGGTTDQGLPSAMYCYTPDFRDFSEHAIVLTGVQAYNDPFDLTVVDGYIVAGGGKGIVAPSGITRVEGVGFEALGGTNGLGGSAMDIGYRGGIFKGCRGANNVASSTLGTSSAGLGMAYLLNVGLAGNSAIIEDCIVQPEGGGSTPKLANIWGASGGDKVYLNRVGTTASAIDNPGGATVVNTTP